MELFKGLTREEFKELKSIIIDIGLIIEFGVKDWRIYLEQCKWDTSRIFRNVLEQLKQNNNIESIIQGVLNERTLL
jgi:hypothetical protein